MRQYIRKRIYFISACVILLSVVSLLVESRFADRAAAQNSSLRIVNGASFTGTVAPGSIATAFGSNLATNIEGGEIPLSNSLAGTNVRLIDSKKAQFTAPLFFSSPGQVNFYVPEGVGFGTMQVIITNSAGVVTRGQVEVASGAPGIVTFNGGTLPIAMTTFDGESYEFVFNPDGSPKAVTAGTAKKPNYLVLFGTGWSSANNVTVRFGQVEVTPIFSGAVEVIPGLSQINVEIPQNLPGGPVSLTVTSDGSVSNTGLIMTPGGPTTFAQSTVGAPGGLTSTAAVGTSGGSTTSTQSILTSNGLSPQTPIGGVNSIIQVTLTVQDVQQIIAQAVAKAQQIGLPVTIAVTDKEGNVLGVFKMNGARNDVTLGEIDINSGITNKPSDPDGLQNVLIPLAGAPAPFNDGAALAAISKAGTASFFSTQGSAVSTRTASFIIQEHQPKKVRNAPGGALFGVQFSQLPCGDVRGLVAPAVLPALPFGLSGDPGSFPLYKNGIAAGAVGIEGNGIYSVDIRPDDFETNNPANAEEVIALAATIGFQPAPFMTANNVFIDGIALAYNEAPPQVLVGVQPFANLPGMVNPAFPIQATPASRFTPLTLAGVPGRVITPNFFPFKDGAVNNGQNLSASDVNTIISQAARGAFRLRAAIRFPLDSFAQVNITVVDINGVILGIFSTQDAPQFGLDVSIQKGRTAAFFSRPDAGAMLRAAEGGRFAKFVDAAAADGVMLDGSIAFSDRAVGFLSRPFLPDGIDNSMNGPFSKPIAAWSPFNVGLQLATIRSSLVNILSGGAPTPCTAIPNLPNGSQIFAGSVPLFKNGVLVGAIGISGDGIEQDDYVASTGSIGFEAPANMRSDAFMVRGTRMPFVKFPRRPNINLKGIN
ncbi:MAG: heme-binding protein [Acidobacteria bacterium]|nr:heme-binding protein [Acidobacteriota bacterium]